MNSEVKKFFIINNLFVIAALLGAIFEQPGIYATFFALSVALQISELKRVPKSKTSDSSY